MYSDYEDDECTASCGVRGEIHCHKYPGCGCGGTTEYDEEDLKGMLKDARRRREWKERAERAAADARQRKYDEKYTFKYIESPFRRIVFAKNRRFGAAEAATIFEGAEYDEVAYFDKEGNNRAVPAASKGRIKEWLDQCEEALEAVRSAPPGKKGRTALEVSYRLHQKAESLNKR